MAMAAAPPPACIALLLGSVQFQCASGASGGDSGYKCFPAILSLGDDWADTGNARSLYHTDLESQEEPSPCGMTFFQNPAHRLSDGKISSLKHLLSSYATGVVSKLYHGISFAVDLKVPYPLLIQIQWVHKFDVLDALAAADFIK